MSWTRFFRRRHEDEELSREIEAYIQTESEQNVSRGMTPEEARYAAQRKFGNARRVREEVRRMNSLELLETIGKDVKLGLRMLRKAPGFTVITILTLALGIGANTAVFSIVNAVFLRPLPFPHSDRIYVVARTGNRLGGKSISMPIFLGWQTNSQQFEHFALLNWMAPLSLSGISGEPERVRAVGISPEFFATFGIKPQIGRDFRPDEGRVGGPHVALLSNAMWRGRFGGDPAIVGRTVTLNDDLFTIVGVLPPDAAIPLPGTRSAQIFVPTQVPTHSDDPTNGAFLAVGLLKPGIQPAQADAELTPPLDELRTQFPNMFTVGERAYLTPIRSFIAGGTGPAPLLLLGAVGLVLLIACANVTNLSLARSTSRQREMTIRSAIGASRGRLLRQLLTESVLLGTLAGLAGIAVCYASFGAITALIPRDMLNEGAYRIDWRVLLFALALGLGTGVLCGLAPALGASRVALNATLQETSIRAGSGRGRLRQLLAITEVAVSVILLIGAALALESFASVVRVSPGFDMNNLTSIGFSLSPKQFDTPQKRTAFIAQALTRLSSIPGVDSAAMADSPPLQGGPDTLISVVGRREGADPLDAPFRIISPAYFQTLRIPLEQGRMFAETDDASSQAVMIVNETMAKWLWPHGNALGQQIWVGKPMGPAYTEPTPRQIVGIVADAREMTLAEPPYPMMYLPVAQEPKTDGGTFMVRAVRTGVVPAASIRAALYQLDPRHPIGQVKTMEETKAVSLTDWRFRAILLSVFGGLALGIAAIGVYGVISYWVAQRTHEIGIRMTLGAERGDVMRLVLRQGLGLSLVGVVVGLAAASQITRLMADVVYGVKPSDPLAFAATSIVLLVVATLACCIPARRAMRVDPIAALRHE